VGQRFLLKLGGAYNWTVHIGNTAVLNRVPGVAVPAGAQGLYMALTPGQTTLTASGDPACRSAKPQCELASLAFSITIVVNGSGTGSSGVSGTAVVSGTPVPAATPTLLPGTTATITQADRNQIVAFTVGQHFLVNLGLPSQYTVNVRVGDPAIVAPVPNAQTPTGTQGIFAALAPGQTLLTVTASPSCYPRCLMPSLAFEVTILVK
jgi:hypothetical protein